MTSPSTLRTGPGALLARLLPAQAVVAETFGDLTDAVSRGAELEGTGLQGAGRQGAELCGAEREGAGLQEAELHEAGLHGAGPFGAELHGAEVLGAELLGAEQAAVAGAVPKRRREFATGRACARAALAGLGLPPAPVLVGPRGAPVWPAGVVGSITHCTGYRAAAVARRTDLASLGVDAEPDEPLPGGVLDQVARPEEQAWLAGREAAEPGGPCWDRLLFCTKEAVYKAWFPLTGEWLGFKDAVVELAADGTFRARLLVPGPVPPGPVPPGPGRGGQRLTGPLLPGPGPPGPVLPDPVLPGQGRAGQRLTGFDGRWRSSHGLLLTAVAVPA